MSSLGLTFGAQANGHSLAHNGQIKIDNLKAEKVIWRSLSYDHSDHEL